MGTLVLYIHLGCNRLGEAINSYPKPIFIVFERLNLEYVISSPKPKEANISLNGTQIAKISKEGNLTFKLVDERDGHEWIFSSKVHGEALLSIHIRDKEWIR